MNCGDVSSKSELAVLEISLFTVSEVLSFSRLINLNLRKSRSDIFKYALLQHLWSLEKQTHSQLSAFVFEGGVDSMLDVQQLKMIELMFSYIQPLDLKIVNVR